MRVNDTYTTEDGLTQILVPYSVEECESIISNHTTVISRMNDDGTENFVITDNGEQYELSLCATDDVTEISAAETMKEFIADAKTISMDHMANTAIITDDGEEVTEFIKNLPTY